MYDMLTGLRVSVNKNGEHESRRRGTKESG